MTFVLAALWWAATRARGRVILTAPVNRQVEDVLWSELKRVCRLQTPSGATVADFLGAQPAVLPRTGMQWPDGREILGFSADRPETMQGMSGPEMLVVVDEGSGVPDSVFEAIEGNTAAKGCRIISASQPTQQSGWFFDAFHGSSEFWEPVHIRSDETPNCTGDEAPIDGLADPVFIAGMKAEHGESSPIFQVRVLGNFAATASNAIIGLALVDEATKQWGKTNPVEQLEYGLDVARFGDDDTCLTPRRGKVAYEAQCVNGFDTLDVVAMVLKDVVLRRRTGEVPIVRIDTSGGYGGGVADVLRKQHSKEVRVVEVNSSEASDDPEQFPNLRSQLHFATAEWLKEGGTLPPDKKLKAELLAPTYGLDTRGRRKVESKDEIKKRIKRSPDRGDSLMLAVYTRRARPFHSASVPSRFED